MSRPFLVLVALLVSVFNFVAGVPVYADNNQCSSALSFGGTSGQTYEGACGGYSETASASWYLVRGSAKQVSYGPKLKYKVTYYRQCEPALMNFLGCDANPEPPCADGSYPLIRMIYAVNGPRKGELVGSTSYCSLEPNLSIPGAAQDIAKVTPERFRELPILASKIISQPENFSLRNGNAHMYADSKTQNFNVVIFDQDVRIRAIPIAYSWSYGDGSTRTLNFPGSPEPDHSFDEATSSSHIYKETGDYGVGLSTRYRGEYSTEGGPWTPIPGVANVPSAPITMSVWRTKKVLVADDCGSDSSAPGCGSIFE